MDVFRDLIDELKEENLLEETVIVCPQNSDTPAVEEPSGSHNGSRSMNFQLVESPEILPRGQTENIETVEPTRSEAVSNGVSPIASKPSNGLEFYKKRAIGELSSLQMVEHVLTGVEREYMKVVPKGFDDFAAKKALNAFIRVSGDENSAEHSEAEFAMMQETEAWCTALAERDRAIPVAYIRQFCENSRPALSSQALVALARFYRNVPYSETVRSKYDFVITRLFSRPENGNRRACLFTREETLSHISLLYKEWSSVSLYPADDDESKVLLTALSFEELANEAENASSFDLLVANDFFGRLGMFKESVSELFFAPNVTAAAIDCNIRVGNAYVTLINNERVKMDVDSMYSKFGSIDNITVSDAAARTLEIVDILRKQRDSSAKAAEVPVNVPPALQTEKLFPTDDAGTATALHSAWAQQVSGNRFISGVLSINRWVLILTVLLITASLGLYGWSTYIAKTEPDTSARTIQLPNSVLRKHLKTARVSGPTFNGLLLPSWDSLSREKKEEYLKIVFDFAKEKGCSEVKLLNSEGNPAASASVTKSEVVIL